MKKIRKYVFGLSDNLVLSDGRRRFVVHAGPVAVLAVGVIVVIGMSLDGRRDSSVEDAGDERARARASQTTLYADNPSHVWNRLHDVLYARIGPDGEKYGAERLDPLLWYSTRYLRNGPSHERAQAVMEEFLSTHAERLVDDPAKRAVLQRDLWAVFDWYVSWFYWYARDVDADEPVKPAFAAALAEIIRRVALTPEQIQELPDNYAATIGLKAFPARFDPYQPKNPFLPPDLLGANSSWVRLGKQWGDHVAPQHTEEFGGRSVFVVFVRLPGGRQATLQYVRQMEKLQRPNEELPQFPAGTQFALVRRMLLVDAEGHLAVTPLVESVQIRVYVEVPSKDRRRRVVEEARRQQAVFEFVLDRARLFRGDAGGLRAVEPAETDFMTFQTHGIDPFEPSERERQEFAKWRFPILGACHGCHSGSGVVSIRSRVAYLGTDDEGTGYHRRAERTMYWKQQRYEWGLLQGLGFAADEKCRR